MVVIPLSLSIAIATSRSHNWLRMWMTGLIPNKESTYFVVKLMTYYVISAVHCEITVDKIYCTSFLFILWLCTLGFMSSSNHCCVVELPHLLRVFLKVGQSKLFLPLLVMVFTTVVWTLIWVEMLSFAVLDMMWSMEWTWFYPTLASILCSLELRCCFCLSCCLLLLSVFSFVLFCCHLKLISV